MSVELLQHKPQNNQPEGKQVSIAYCIFLLVLSRLVYVFGLALVLLPKVLFQYIIVSPIALIDSLINQSAEHSFLDTSLQHLTYSWPANFIHILTIVLIICLYKARQVNFFSEKVWIQYELARILIYTTVFVILALFLHYLFGFFSPTFNTLPKLILDYKFALTSNTSLLMSAFVSVVILTPMAEEIIYRGTFSIIFAKYHYLGLLVCSIAFSLTHGTNELLSYIWYLIIGLGLGAIYWKTERIEASIFAHVVLNLFQYMWIMM